MAFTSKLNVNEVIIGDETPERDYATPEGFSTGLDLGLRNVGYGEVPYCSGFDLQLIPRSEWQARIQEQEQRKTRTSDLTTQAGLPCKDQNGTNYCWINAPVYCVETIRVVQNQPMVLLSPGSVGGPIKNYRNVGGWGGEGLEYIVKNGVVPVSMYPANQTRNAHTNATRAEALKYRVREWNELRPRNLDQLITCLLLNLPVAIGLNWWGHEVTACDAVWLDGEVAVRQRNSWGMGWGDRGYGILRGSKMLPDDAVTPRSVVPS